MRTVYQIYLRGVQISEQLQVKMLFYFNHQLIALTIQLVMFHVDIVYCSREQPPFPRQTLGFFLFEAPSLWKFQLSFLLPLKTFPFQIHTPCNFQLPSMGWLGVGIFINRRAKLVFRKCC